MSPVGQSPRGASSTVSSSFGSSCGVTGGVATASAAVAATRNVAVISPPASCTFSSGKTSMTDTGPASSLTRLAGESASRAGASRSTSRTLNSSRQRLPSRETQESSSVPISVHFAARVTGTRLAPARFPPRSTVCSDAT